jgi:propionyl-CoA carboxylase alpha chain
VYDKILIANRGEIAVRIIKTCRRLGIETVAVYSEVDFRSPYVELADQSVFIGGARAQESYLNAQKIIGAALNTGCQAIHPGYGFLSENAAFAQSVKEAGLAFIGPPAEAIALLGDKIASKALADRIGLPVVAGRYEPLGELEEALAVATQLGFPVLLKPAAGGGGRGMRIVDSPSEFAAALSACREEVRKGFSDHRIFIEQYVVRPRHIEIQIMADHHGNVIHLGERECSVQRRYQKVIEESPSVAVDSMRKLEMGRAACSLAREAGYTNAGTVEFILATDGTFYFLEMNTRLQVEHPVTELVTGLDLVELQIRIASGEPLSLRQEDVALTGWAMEARVCAEDPSRGFLPTTGMITRYAVPRGEHIRVDSGIDAGSVISIYYDSLLAKVVAWGEDRDTARQRLIRALNGYHIEGLTTNVDFVNAIANHTFFAQGDLSTGFIEEHFSSGESKMSPDREHLRYMAMASLLVFHSRQSLVRASVKPMTPHVGGSPTPKKSREYIVRMDHEVFHVQLEGDPVIGLWTISVNGTSYQVRTPEFEFYRRRLILWINGRSHMFRMQYDENHIKTFFCGIVRTFEIYTPAEWRLAHYMRREKKALQENALRCPMPGLITAVYVTEGEYVRKGQELLRMESMKMESGIASPYDAYVETILVRTGQTVETDEVLIGFRT